MGRSYGLGSLDPKIGLFLSILASIGLAVGSFLVSKVPEGAHPSSPPAA